MGVSDSHFLTTEPQIFSAPEKACTKCGEAKPRTIDHFPSDARKVDGLRADCRACFSAARCQSHARRRERLGLAYTPNAKAYSARKIGRYAVAAEVIRPARGARPKKGKGRKIADRLRDRIRRALGPIPKGHYSLGCTPAALRVHIERQFLKGMSWENRSRWHIDHIRPLASFDLTDPEQLRAACHFTNLRPMWAEDNVRKGAMLEVLL